MNLGGSQWWDELAPLAYGSLADAQRASGRSLGAKMRNDSICEHGIPSYPMGNAGVNYGTWAVAAICPPMEPEETTGDRIKRLREAKGLTLPALTRLLISMGAPETLTKAALSKAETGDTKNMQNATFALLAQALGTDIPYLLWGADRAPKVRRSPSTAHTKAKS
jgi:hypothetical protein